jgi:hypothetical protein
MADNVEGSAAKSMAGSVGSGTGAARDIVKNIWLFGGRASGSNSGSPSSSSSSSSTPNNRPAYTSEEVDNYNKYLKTHYKLQNKLEKKRHVRNAETNANNEVLRNASEDARHLRNKDVLDHAMGHGQVADIDIDHSTGRNKISFKNSPARATNPGKGTGAQGSSKQQNGRGAKIGKAGGAILGGLVTENPAGAAVGAKFGEKLGETIDKKIADRGAKAAGAKAGTKPGMTAKEAKATAAAASYVTPAKGKKLTPEVKAQNAAARTYAPRGKKA